jgi:hypothetical protein
MAHHFHYYLWLCRRAKRKREWLSQCDENGVHPSLVGKLGRGKTHDVAVRDGKLVCIRVDKSRAVSIDPVAESCGAGGDEEAAELTSTPSPATDQSWRFRVTSIDPSVDFCDCDSGDADSRFGPGWLLVDVEWVRLGGRLVVREVARCPSRARVCRSGCAGPYSRRLVEVLMVQTLSRLPAAAGEAGRDLHSCGPGELYGGSYTLYPPMAGGHRHSLATVAFASASDQRCGPPGGSLRARELLAFCRIQNQVAKTAVVGVVASADPAGGRIDRPRADAEFSAILGRLRLAHAELALHRQAAAPVQATAAAPAVASKDGKARRARNKGRAPPAPCFFVAPPECTQCGAEEEAPQHAGSPRDGSSSSGPSATISFLSFTFSSASQKACVY